MNEKESIYEEKKERNSNGIQGGSSLTETKTTTTTESDQVEWDD